MSSFNIIGIRILPNCSLNVKKVLKENKLYLFSNKYIENNGRLIINPNYSVPDNFYSNKVNITAIVGKNGSGKSAIIDILIRLINNIAVHLTSKANTSTRLQKVYGINAELIYEIDSDIFTIISDNNKVYFKKNDEIIEKGDYYDVGDHLNTLGDFIDFEDAKPILKQLFFTMVNNFSFHSYNSTDFWEANFNKNESWINGLFHKNDGYLTPIVLNPFRDRGKIDLIKETNLANNRLASLFYSFKKEGIDLIDGYEFKSLSFAFNKNHVDKKYLLKDKNGKEYIKKVSIKKGSLTYYNFILGCYFNDFEESSEEIGYAYKYIVVKTLQIPKQYPRYKNNIKIYVQNLSTTCRSKDKERIQKLVSKIKKDESHITLKIRQTIKYIEYCQENKNSKLNLLDENYISIPKKDEIIFNLDEFVALFPPPFYNVKINLKNNTNNEIHSFEEMSSGERQFLFNISTILYHLKNLDSVVDEKQSVHYENINIILEEIELYFHPEYQRVFINKLLRYIDLCNFARIKHLNFIIVTHSPFILSDIPKDNILFIKDGEQANDKIDINPFGANIHDMLRNNFFLENGLTGDFAKKQIKRVICYLKDNCEQEYCNKDNIKQIIDMIGEPLIKDRLVSMYEEKHGENNRGWKSIKELEQENEYLKKEIANLKRRL